LTEAIEELAPEAFDAELPEWVVLYIGIVGSIREEISEMLQSLDYLGPLRERPRRLYMVSGETPQEVGQRGQFAPELLFRADASFRRRVARWLRRMDLGVAIGAPEIGDDAFSIELKRYAQSPWVNMADSGFGVSQVLPLIVQSLRADHEGLLIAEQPEIHLNPRIQALLADLFVSTASDRRPIIVETHSEHLVLRLRRLIAEGSIESKDVALYFTEKTGDESTIREVPILEDGRIRPDTWPSGFFEESLTQALGLAQAQMRKRENG
jgi:hypothetical protein